MEDIREMAIHRPSISRQTGNGGYQNERQERKIKWEDALNHLVNRFKTRRQKKVRKASKDTRHAVLELVCTGTKGGQRKALGEKNADGGPIKSLP